MRCPARSPSLCASTAPSCSTKIRVVSPATSASGRNEAARALARRRGHDHDGPGQELVSLDDNSITVAGLFAPNAFRNSEPVDITPEHEAPPSTRRQRTSLSDRPRQPPGRRPRQRSPYYDDGAGPRRARPRDGFGLAQAGRLERPKRPVSFIVQTNGDRSSHGPTVSHFVVQRPKLGSSIPAMGRPGSTPPAT